MKNKNNIKAIYTLNLSAEKIKEKHFNFKIVLSLELLNWQNKTNF